MLGYYIEKYREHCSKFMDLENNSIIKILDYENP